MSFEELSKEIMKKFPFDEHPSQEWMKKCIDDKDLASIKSYLEEITWALKKSKEKNEIVEDLYKKCVKLYYKDTIEFSFGD